MSGNRVALDTNKAIAWLNGSMSLEVLTDQYELVALPVVVLGELKFGMMKSARSEENLKRLQQLIDRSSILNVDSSTSDVYATIRLDLMKKGRPIPENDLWIAAICIENRLPLLTADRHFDAITHLTVVDE